MKGRRVAAIVALTVVVAACGTGDLADTGSTNASDTLTLEELLAVDPVAIHRAFAECLRAKGWSATIDETSGAVVSEVAEGQEPAYDRAAQECQQASVEAGLTPDPDRPVAEDVVRYFYERDLAYHDCLASHGYPVTDPPSWDRYLAMSADVGEFWAPNQLVFEAAMASGSTELLQDAARDCPPAD